MPKIFDIETAESLFKMLEFRYREYCMDEKDTEDLISILMMANHLREWIAPEYHRCSDGGWPPADTPAKRFSRQIYEDGNFAVVRALCNGTKHAKAMQKTATEFEPRHLSGPVYLTGIPSAHLVDGKNIEEHLNPVMDLYRDWFLTTSN